MNLRYILGLPLAVPLLPFLYFQGKKIRRTVPVLSEAGDPDGISFGRSKQRLHVLLIGESTMAGVGVDSHETGFAGTLARKLSEQLRTTVSWQVFARSGYTARLMAHRLLPKVTTTHVDLIVIGVGGNDAFRLTTPAKWRRHITVLIKILKQRFSDAPIVFINMPPIKEFPAFTPLIRLVIGNLVQILGQELQKVTDKFDRVYYNKEIIRLKDWKGRFNSQLPPDELFFRDGVHPLSLTYQTWAEDTVRFILDKKVL